MKSFVSDQNTLSGSYRKLCITSQMKILNIWKQKLLTADFQPLAMINTLFLFSEANLFHFSWLISCSGGFYTPLAVHHILARLHEIQFAEQLPRQ